MSKRDELTYQLKIQIAQAVIELLKVKPLNKITVDELTELAHVGRVTYFRHFTSKEEIISFCLRENYLNWMKAQLSVEATLSEMDKGMLYFEYYLAHRELHTLIINHGLENLMLDAYISIIAPTEAEVDNEQLYEAVFKAYGIFGATLRWLKNDCPETPETMARLYFKLLTPTQ